MEQPGYLHIRHRYRADSSDLSVRIGIAFDRFISVHRYLAGSGTGVFSSDTLHRDTVKCQLMDSVTHRMGKGIYMYQYDVPLPPMTLHRGQTGQVRIIHLMQRKSFRAYTMWESSSAAKALIPLGQIASGIYTQEYEQQDGEAPQG